MVIETMLHLEHSKSITFCSHDSMLKIHRATFAQCNFIMCSIYLTNFADRYYNFILLHRGQKNEEI
jgi:hypothetical protein